MTGTTMTGGVAVTTGMAALATSLTPTAGLGTIGGEMNLALQIHSGNHQTTAGTHTPTTTAFYDRYNIYPLFDATGAVDLSNFKAIVRPRFTSALLDAVGKATKDKPQKVINDHLDNRYDTVPFDVLEAAGLVTHEAVSNYLNTVQDCVLNVLNSAGARSARRRISLFQQLTNISVCCLLVGVAVPLGIMANVSHEGIAPDMQSVVNALIVAGLGLIGGGIVFGLPCYAIKETLIENAVRAAETLITVKKQLSAVEKKEI